MSFNKMLLLAVSMTLVSGQRPSFAGSRPIGFPEVVKPTTEAGLGNRFGDDDVSTTTIRLPLEANGDRDLIDRLSKLPEDQQPFWFINWQALEAHRRNPQTYPQKPNVFAEPGINQQATQQSTGSAQTSSNFNQMPSNNFNQPPNNVNQPPNNVNQPPTNNQASNGLGNRFSDMDLVPTTQRPLSLEELYNSQRIKPVKNADGTTSWQIVDPSVVEALEKIQNKNQTKS